MNMYYQTIIFLIVTCSCDVNGQSTTADVSTTTSATIESTTLDEFSNSTDLYDNITTTAVEEYESTTLALAPEIDGWNHVLAPLQELPLPDSGILKSIEDCYGYNVKIWRFTKGRCMYSRTTYTSCETDEQCAVLPNTICLQQFCQCRYGYGIKYYLQDSCQEITLNNRWKNERKRWPPAIQTKIPWGEDGDYSEAVKYSGIYIFIGFFTTLTFLAFILIKLCHQNHKQKEKKEDPVVMQVTENPEEMEEGEAPPPTTLTVIVAPSAMYGHPSQVFAHPSQMYGHPGNMMQHPGYMSQHHSAILHQRGQMIQTPHINIQSPSTATTMAPRPPAPVASKSATSVRKPTKVAAIQSSLSDTHIISDLSMPTTVQSDTAQVIAKSKAAERPVENKVKKSVSMSMFFDAERHDSEYFLAQLIPNHLTKQTTGPQNSGITADQTGSTGASPHAEQSAISPSDVNVVEKERSGAAKQSDDKNNK